MWNFKLTFFLASVCYWYLQHQTNASKIFNRIAVNQKPKNNAITTMKTNAGERCTSMCSHNERCQSYLVQEVAAKTFKCTLYDMEFRFLELEADSDPGTSTYFSIFNIYKIDCLDHFKSGATTDGVYEIYLPTGPKRVYCHMDEAVGSNGPGGGWLSIQRRIDGDVNFHRTWLDYKNGFGEVDDEFWLGNEVLHYLTTTYPHQFYVRATSFDGNEYISKHDDFLVQSEASNYRMTASSNPLDGTLISLDSNHNNKDFSTKDDDNDDWGNGSVASRFDRGGFWYGSGANFIPNGKYHPEGSHNVGSRQGMVWSSAKGTSISLETMELMIRRKP